MSPLRALSFVSTLALAALSVPLLAAGCNTEPTPSSDGPLGSTQAGATLATPGFVETTVFAARIGSSGGFGVPNGVVREAVASANGAVSTGPCAR